MIIAVAGKMSSGKDTVGKIIQLLTDGLEWSDDGIIDMIRQNKVSNQSNWEIKKFANKLKDIVCLLINCTREQLEDAEFKNTELGEEWIKYAYADGHNDHYRNGEWTKSMHSISCNKEIYEEQYRINWQTAYKRILTPRLLLQLLGTECGRDIIHPNIWVSSLMSEYKELSVLRDNEGKKIFDANGNHQFSYPNWIITDMRFPNELQAVKDKGGISIRVERGFDIKIQRSGNIDDFTIEKFDKNNPKHVAFKQGELLNQHSSEKLLDNAEFDYTIDNDGTIEELIEKVKEILIRRKII